MMNKKVSSKHLLIAIVTIFFGFVFLAAKTSPPSQPAHQETLEEENHSTMAKVFTQRIVEKSLKAPSTAKFPWVMNAISSDNKYFIINSYVDAENGFGAMIREKFNMQIEYQSGDDSEFSSWDVKYYRLGEDVIVDFDENIQ